MADPAAPVFDVAPDAALTTAVLERLALPGWSCASDRDGVAVWVHRALPDPVVGYRTVTEHPVSAEAMASFLGERLLGAFSRMNARFAFGDVLATAPLVVRTGFSMPFGFAPREFVHRLAVTPVDDEVTVVAYGPADEDGLAAPRPGYLRCPIYPSGQRITALAPHRCRVEHLMTYALAGRVPIWAQNAWFHRGHVQAYHAEWHALVVATTDASTTGWFDHAA
jgi:hypothetical protein